ncbi:glycine cleavage system protein GcvH [Rathayibacter toxicus]|uniref:glycine cleavage system protein GcvH n=1 Tax=Rathayibacter toxicus TaxID=145458 RepID=UPI000CE795F1|nr:glycine cleavage system protein GcvH [Rathayibacter toxicus]PPI54276.1 glycine cleavage system protein H [Rathayibacter toxicus]QOD11022.1 glycine cleavage system protein GcvH [Rathayibacter toxicus]QWL27765.1 glycine cleavage system protein GcvH [Rathayibacter toxicus]
MAVPTELHYTTDHEWIRLHGNTATVGVTAYAADKLGDVVFVELPEVGTNIDAGSVVGEIESTKSVGEIFAPLDGEVLEINSVAVDTPELVNSDPFGQGWLMKVRFDVLPDFLLSSAAYSELIGE